MIAISGSSDWRTLHLDATIGILEISNVNNSAANVALNERKQEVELRLRERYNGYSRADFLAVPVMTAYEQYYKRFDKTYHVQLQLESIVLKGKTLPNVSPLVDSNFAAELETLVLTAGHDVSKLSSPLLIDVSREGDQITQMNGSTKPIRPGDMVMRDKNGISCTIIYGQDNRSPISADTNHALYVAYAPGGVPAEVVSQQLQGIEDNIKLFSPNCIVEQRMLIRA